MRIHSNMGWVKGTLVLLLAIGSWSGVLAKCPVGCTCDDESLHVNCVDASIDIVPYTLNPSVRKLILRSNRIRSVDSGFSFYHELTHIDLSHNHLLKILPATFSSQTKLVQLHLNNNKISSLSNLTFQGQGLPALAVLNLRENLLEALPPGIFTYSPNLQEVDLGQNSIRSLGGGALAGLDRLRILKLDNNELGSVPPIFGNRSSPGLPHLAELFMGMNTMERLEGGAFAGLPSLGLLDLRGCHLNWIDPSAFSGLAILKKLILSDNNLAVVPGPAFPPLQQLEVLKIGRNPITTLGPYTFSSLNKLKVMEMSGAPELGSVDPAAFLTNLDLETVEVSNGKKLLFLPPKLFSGISSIKNLILKENALTSLPEDLGGWTSLRNLRLEGNPFSCTCDLAWLRDLLLLDRFANASTLVHCHGPPELAERRIRTLTDKELQCYLGGPLQKTILGLSIGFAILLLAVFFFLLYRYHDRIKGMCKRGRGQGARSRGSGAVKAAELDTATKTSFLSQSAYAPYAEEEYALRTSLMPGGPSGAYHAQSLGRGGPYNMHSLSHPHHYTPQHQHQHQHQQQYSPYVQGGGLPNYVEAEYETPHVNLGVGGLNLHFPHHYASPSHNGHQAGIHYNHKPIPITEL